LYVTDRVVAIRCAAGYGDVQLIQPRADQTAKLSGASMSPTRQVGSVGNEPDCVDDPLVIGPAVNASQPIEDYLFPGAAGVETPEYKFVGPRILPFAWVAAT